MQTTACFRGKFGSTEYYQTKMSAGDLINTVGFAKEMPEYEELTADEKIQRDLDINRVIMEMVPYITEDPDRFFSSIVVDIYQGFEDVEFEPLENVNDFTLFVSTSMETKAGRVSRLSFILVKKSWDDLASLEIINTVSFEKNLAFHKQ